MIRTAPLLAVALWSAAAVAGAQPGPASATGDSPYAAYLVGRAALAAGHDREGAADLEALAARYPDQDQLRRQAFEAALYAGDMDSAAGLAPQGMGGDSNLASLGRIVRAGQALATGDAASANAALDFKSIEAPFRPAAYMLKPWAAAMAGDWTGALAEPPAADRVSELVAGFARAELFEIKGEQAKAETVYKEITADSLGQRLFRTRYGEFLERRGRTKDAIAVYDAGLKAEPENVLLSSARARALSGQRPPQVVNLRQGAAQAMTFAAAALGSRDATLGMIYLRLALKLEPAQDEALVQLGDALSLLHDGPGARDAWSKVPQTSKRWIEARAELADSLSADGDTEGALKVARALAQAAPHDMAAQFTLADLLRTSDHEEEALTVFDRIEKDGGGKNWRIRYARALTLDKLGRWGEAEAELKAAMELSPGEPEIENYLGYTWIDRGDHVKEGMALVEKAVAARPESGAMQDSLGWAHYRLKDYAEAVSVLERAVELDPADPEVNDHLGDAYWMVGRKIEAGYQWDRVLTLQPDAKLKAKVERKLKDGLGASQVADR